MKNLKSRMKEKGFTLIELLVVISIIGMLSSVVLVSLQSARDKGRVGAGLSFDTSTYHAFGAEAVLRYDFNNSASIFSDSSGNGNNGTCSSPAYDSSKTPNNSGGSISLTNSSCIINVSKIPRGANLASKGSVSFWIYPNAYPISGTSDIAHIPSTRGWIKLNSSGIISLQDSGTVISSLDSIPKAAWTHVLISWDNTGGDNTWLYINGKRNNTSTNNPAPVFPDNIYIGSWPGGPAFDGNIDNFAIYTQSMQNP